MNWNKWLHQFGLIGGIAVLSGVGLAIAGMLTWFVQVFFGDGFQLVDFFSAVLVSLVLGVPLSYLLMLTLFQLDDANLDLLRKEAQVDYLKKMSAQNGGSEKDQLISDLNSFAQTVAHDLKTPLTTVLGFATMLADHQAVLPPEQQKDALQAIVRTSLKMNNIIQELLLLAAVRQSTVRTGPIQMNGIIGAAKQRLRGVLDESRVQLIMPDASAWPKVIGYSAWIEEVWINYISNAIKYGGEPPVVELGVDPDYCKTSTGRSMARFWVRDNGQGILLADQEQLFTQFTRLDQVKAEGHGLGLSIVARIIEKLGGEVGVESIIGQGSLFYFTLPMLIVEPPTRARPDFLKKQSN